MNQFSLEYNSRVNKVKTTPHFGNCQFKFIKKKKKLCDTLKRNSLSFSDNTAKNSVGFLKREYYEVMVLEKSILTPKI